MAWAEEMVPGSGEEEMCQTSGRRGRKKQVEGGGEGQGGVMVPGKGEERKAAEQGDGQGRGAKLGLGEMPAVGNQGRGRKGGDARREPGVPGEGRCLPEGGGVPGGRGRGDARQGRGYGSQAGGHCQAGRAGGRRRTAPRGLGSAWCGSLTCSPTRPEHSSQVPYSTASAWPAPAPLQPKAREAAQGASAKSEQLPKELGTGGAHANLSLPSRSGDLEPSTNACGNGVTWGGGHRTVRLQTS